MDSKNKDFQNALLCAAHQSAHTGEPVEIWHSEEFGMYHMVANSQRKAYAAKPQWKHIATYTPVTK